MDFSTPRMHGSRRLFYHHHSSSLSCIFSVAGEVSIHIPLTGNEVVKVTLYQTLDNIAFNHFFHWCNTILSYIIKC
ncbi:hypothetical protein PUN28_011344 [Cardiocondyla obscurior]|uniref:Uncharacterized protein n=1 Tax=Cardiocondyla obscurior TaxID=286306 RepID=A0AAW2FEK4_9HYME